MMMACIAPPIFSLWRKSPRGPSRRFAAHLGGPCTVQKTHQEGDFDFPLLDLPLKRHKGRGCGPFLWKLSPGTGAAAAEREVKGVAKHRK